MDVSSRYQLLADLILTVHFAIVTFIIGGLIAIWVGKWRDWGWVRGRLFRWSHVLLMGFVAVQASLGRWCPLTIWEAQLRRRAGQSGVYEESFIKHWLQKILYYDVHPAILTALYVAFLGVVVWTWWKVPPRPRSAADQN